MTPPQLSDTLSDMFRQMVLDGEVAAGCAKAKRLAEYANDALTSISHQYDCIVPIFDEETLHVAFIKATRPRPAKNRACPE